MEPPVLSLLARLEVKPELRGQRSWRHVMRPAEGRQEVVERVFVGHIDDCELRAPFVLVAMEQIVMPERNIE